MWKIILYLRDVDGILGVHYRLSTNRIRGSLCAGFWLKIILILFSAYIIRGITSVECWKLALAFYKLLFSTRIHEFLSKAASISLCATYFHGFIEVACFINARFP